VAELDVVGKVATLLRLFSEAEPELSLALIRERSGLPKPTAHRLLGALAREGFVYQDPTTRLYGLGAGLVHVAAPLLHHDHLGARATALLQDLQGVCGESVSLQLRVGNERLCVREVVSRHDLRVSAGPGRVRPLYAGAASKAILAFLPEREQRQVLAALASMAGNARMTALGNELAAIQGAGYATSVAENTPGASAIAAPVFEGQRVVGAVNISGPESRWTPEAMLPCVDALVRTARAVSALVGLPNALEALA